jgi:hypothetical protein
MHSSSSCVGYNECELAESGSNIVFERNIF